MRLCVAQQSPIIFYCVLLYELIRMLFFECLAELRCSERNLQQLFELRPFEPIAVLWNLIQELFDVR